MSDRRLVFDMQTLHVLQRFYNVANFTCNGVGDMGLVAYVTLLDISEFREGVSIRKLEHNLDCVDDPDHFLDVLERYELVERKRDRSDKRTFAFSVTPRGRTRIEYIDEALAVALVGSNTNLDEEVLGALIERFAAYEQLYEGRYTATMFPATVLLGLMRYAMFLSRTCMPSGLSPLQVSMLCILGSANAPCSAKYVAERTALYDSIVEYQLWHLTEKRLARYDNGFSLTSTGLQRVENVLRELNTLLDAEYGAFEDDKREAVAELRECLVFLFG